jgi:hypothetical protein
MSFNFTAHAQNVKNRIIFCFLLKMIIIIKNGEPNENSINLYWKKLGFRN